MILATQMTGHGDAPLKDSDKLIITYPATKKGTCLSVITG